MENNEIKKNGIDVWVLIQVSLGISTNEGMFPIGVYESQDEAEIALARTYADLVDDYDGEQIADVFYVRQSKLFASFQTPPPTFNLEVQHLLAYRIPRKAFSSPIFCVGGC